MFATQSASSIQAAESEAKKLAIDAREHSQPIAINWRWELGGEIRQMPRTRTTFKPGHKGMGGRPKGSRNRAKEDWRAAQRRAQEVGAICDALLAELAKPKRRNRMKARQWARVLKVITTRQKSHLARSQHVRPVVPTGRRPLRGLNMVYRPWSENVRPESTRAPKTDTSEAGKERRPK